MIYDPILAAKVLLGIRVPPHMELRLLLMWTSHFTSDDSGISTGKSFTHAVVACLRSILFPDRTSGIISATFRQGQLIFQNILDWYDKSPLFRYHIRHEKGQRKIVGGNSVNTATFNNGSQIRMLPPSQSKNATNLRSERWNDLYLDEWTTFGHYKMITGTMFGRVTKTQDFKDCPVRQNHIHLTSTPHYTYHPSYSIIKLINRNMKSHPGDWARFTCNYTNIPDNDKWGWLFPRKTITTMVATNTASFIKSEVLGLWQKGSISYYDQHLIDLARCVEGETCDVH